MISVIAKLVQNSKNLFREFKLLVNFKLLKITGQPGEKSSMQGWEELKEGATWLTAENMEHQIIEVFDMKVSHHPIFSVINDDYYVPEG